MGLAFCSSKPTPFLLFLFVKKQNKAKQKTPSPTTKHTQSEALQW